MTLCAYEVDCADVLDLTIGRVRDAVAVAERQLSCAWEDMAARGETPPSWRLATELLAAHCAGIVVPSFASNATGRDINVVFWKWSRGKPHKVRVIDDDGRLPKDDRSWR